MKNKAKNLKFPRIYRKIPEHLEFLHVLENLKKMAIVFAFASVFVFILFITADLYKNFINIRQIQAQRQKLIHEIKLWESFSEKYKNYKEVYFQIAIREFELGNFNKVRQSLQKALFIDPNYEEALKLQKEIKGK